MLSTVATKRPSSVGAASLAMTVEGAPPPSMSRRNSWPTRPTPTPMGSLVTVVTDRPSASLSHSGVTSSIVFGIVIADSSARDRRGRPFLFYGVQLRVLDARVDEVLVVEHAHLREPLAEPRGARVEQTQLLAVRHDLREQHALEEDLLVAVLANEVRNDRPSGHAETFPDLLMQEAVAHPQ